MDKIKQLLKKFLTKEIIFYIIFGVITTLINLLSFWLMNSVLNWNENLANAILDLYHHPEKRQQMSAASFERSKRFDKETYAKNFFAALENIL